MRGTIAISTSPRTWPKYDPPLQRDLWRDHSTCRLHQQPTRKRKRVEEIFGWIRVASMRRDSTPRSARVGWKFTFTAAAYNLVQFGTSGGGLKAKGRAVLQALEATRQETYLPKICFFSTLLV